MLYRYILPKTRIITVNMTQKMLTKAPQKILKGDRVSIPREFLKSQNLQVGDYVLVESTDKGLRIVPAQIIPRD